MLRWTVMVKPYKQLIFNKLYILPFFFPAFIISWFSVYYKRVTSYAFENRPGIYQTYHLIIKQLYDWCKIIASFLCSVFLDSHISSCSIVWSLNAIIIASHKTYHLLVAGSYTTLPKKLCHQLNDRGVEILFAATREKLTGYLHESISFDAVLVDHDENSAASVTEIINRGNKPANHPLLILTSKFRTSSMALALQAGFDEFLAKPLHATELMTIIKKSNKNKS